MQRRACVGYQVTREYRQLRNSVEEARAQAEIAGFRRDTHQRTEHSTPASERAT